MSIRMLIWKYSFPQTHEVRQMKQLGWDLHHVQHSQGCLLGWDVQLRTEELPSSCLSASQGPQRDPDWTPNSQTAKLERMECTMDLQVLFGRSKMINCGAFSAETPHFMPSPCPHLQHQKQSSERLRPTESNPQV